MASTATVITLQKACQANKHETRLTVPALASVLRNGIENKPEHIKNGDDQGAEGDRAQ